MTPLILILASCGQTITAEYNKEEKVGQLIYRTASISTRATGAKKEVPGVLSMRVTHYADEGKPFKLLEAEDKIDVSFKVVLPMFGKDDLFCLETDPAGRILVLNQRHFEALGPFQLFMTSLSVKDLRRLANAKQVKGSWGNKTFRLSPKDRKELGRFLSIVTKG